MEGRLWLRGLVASRDGRDVIRGESEASVVEPDEAASLGLSLADDFLARGASRLTVEQPR